MDITTDVSKLPLVGPAYKKRLKRLDIKTIGDLIHHIPHRYIDYSLTTNISQTRPDEAVTIRAKVISIKNVYTKSRKKIQIAEVEDDSGKMAVIWFNQPYLVKNIQKGALYSFSGEVGFFSRKKALISPEYEKLNKKGESLHTGRLVPKYPETGGVSSKWLRGRINYAIRNLEGRLEEFLPEGILKKLDLSGYEKAIKSIHFPKSQEVAEKAKRRLSFNELLMLQLGNQYRKLEWNERNPVHTIKIDDALFEKFSKNLPFDLTNSQKRAINEIFEDLKKDSPMNRLLEGDVGSGKTVVAAAAAFASFVDGHQTVFMAPTQILAKQHFDTLKEVFEKFKIRVSLITSSGIEKDIGKTDLFIGTHALIHKSADFGATGGYSNVALVVIDEQHRFGVEQRAHLVKKTGSKNTAPHVLTMTATPIPRTVALTFYGDLDLSTLDELPKGRKPITTWLVPPQKREGAYEWIRKEIKKRGVQAFVICPLIEESEKESMKQVKAATSEFEKLKNLFPDLNVDILHGKQKMKKKNEVVKNFKKKKADILVATPVVEVGIDVPNATIMIIEGAERFGLAQLHQLRGRVGRGSRKSYCLLFTEGTSKKALSRLKALEKSRSGFELAEIDLQLRGPGEIYGTRQHGFPELKIASWQDVELIKAAKEVAGRVVRQPDKYPKLIKKVKSEKIVPN